MIWTKVARIDEWLALPKYQTAGASGMDIYSTITYTLRPGERKLFPAGISIQLPQGYEGQIRSRSGLAFKHGVVVLNAPGTIDRDFTGEVGVLLINHGTIPYKVERGDRIAQLVVAPVEQSIIQEVFEDLTETERGGGGFGSTGV